MKEQKNSEDKILTIPNILTVCRIVGSIGLLSFIAKNGIQDRALVVGTTAVLGITDVLDGFIARHFHMESKLGGVIDPIADKIFAYGIGAVLMAKGIMPFWPLAVGIRDITVWSLTFHHYMKTEEAMKPTPPAKLKMVLQSSSILSTLLFDWGKEGLSVLAPCLMGAALSMAIPEIFFIHKRYFSKQDLTVQNIDEIMRENSISLFDQEDVKNSFEDAKENVKVLRK